MNASNLASLVNAGTPVVIPFTDATGREYRPTITRATVQRFGALDLVTFHEQGAPDHIAMCSYKPEQDVPYEIA
jgi:hypothetical protein